METSTSLIHRSQKKMKLESVATTTAAPQVSGDLVGNNTKPSEPATAAENRPQNELKLRFRDRIDGQRRR